MVCNRYDTAQTPFYRIKKEAINHEELLRLCAMLGQIDEPFSVIDGGAHVGTWPMYLKSLTNLHQLHCFEPVPEFYEMLCETLALNGLEHRVLAHPLALSDTHGRISVPNFDWTKPTNFGGVELGDEQKEFIGQHRLQSERVAETFQIDELLGLESPVRGLMAPVRFIKLDVEGMEINALRGAVKTIERDRPILFVEFIKSNQQELLDFFAQHNYRVDRWHTDFLCLPN